MHQRGREEEDDEDDGDGKESEACPKMRKLNEEEEKIGSNQEEESVEGKIESLILADANNISVLSLWDGWLQFLEEHNAEPALEILE